MPTDPSQIAPGHLTLDMVLEHWSVLRPEDPALTYPHDPAKNLSWWQFQQEVLRYQWALVEEISCTRPVGIVCCDEPEFHILVNALWRCGVSILLIDRNWGASLVTDLVRFIGCEVVFSPGQSLDLPEDIFWRLYPNVKGTSVSGALLSRSKLDDIALYATTSGTTNDPKCIPILHRKLRIAYATCMLVHDFSDRRSAACLFEVNSLGILGVCFLLPRETGASTAVLPAFSISNFARSWNYILSSDVGYVYLVPPLLRLINTLPADGGGRFIPLFAICAAAPVSVVELETIERKFPVKIFNAYGLTELSFAVFFGCRNYDGSPTNSIGYPVNIGAKLVDSEGRIIEGAGTGELYVTGPMLNAGYLRNEVATAQNWIEGWLKTGDLVERDMEGRYFVRGRLKDTVLRGGYTYYLYEIEYYLRQIVGVQDVCAFRGRSIPSGEEMCVYIQTQDQLSKEYIFEWIRAHMGIHKVPNAIYITSESLPRNSNGKIDRHSLTMRHFQNRNHEAHKYE